MAIATLERPVDFRVRGAAKALIESNDEEVVCSGPAGTGKSFAVLAKLHLIGLGCPDVRMLVVRKTLVSLTSSGLVTFQKKVLNVLDRGGIAFYGGSPSEPAAFRYPKGGVLVVGGMDKTGKVLSSEYDIIAVLQAEELSLDEWETLSTRLRAGVLPYQQIIGDCNPAAPSHWIRQRAETGHLRLLDSRHEDNPAYHDGRDWTEEGRRYLARLQGLTGIRRERLLLGHWAAAEGLIYSQFDRSRHLITSDELVETGLVDADLRPEPYVCEIIAGVDWGFTNPGVIQVYAVDHDGRAVLLEEVYATEKLLDWWLERAQEIADRYAPSVWIADPSEPAFIAQFADAGHTMVPAPNAIIPGIETTQRRLKGADDGIPRVFFLADANRSPQQSLLEAGRPTGVVGEIESYVWAKNADGRPSKEMPALGQADHGADTLRYCMAWLDEVGSAPAMRWA